MPYGYTGKAIFVNLTKKEVIIEELPECLYRNVLGGEGIGAWLLNEKVPKGADPLGPDNLICVAPGLFSATGVPAGPRVMVMTKSPLTGGFGDSNAGGAFGPELKKCGYDAICITGTAESLVYLYIKDDKVEIRDASHMKEKDTVETKESLIKELEEPKLKVAAIGQAGEKKSLIAAIMFDDRAAARSGVGAVMGSKNLKCIAVKGSRKIPMADKETVKVCNNQFRDNIKKTDYFVIDVMRKYGSCGFISIGIKAGIAPIKNWLLAGEEHFPEHAKLDGENVVKYRTKRHGCLACPVACGGTVKVENGPYQLDGVRLPEYETLNAFGPFVMCDDVEACFKAQELCDRAGLDTISAGNAVAFAVECFENKILTKEDTDGLELIWGNAEAIIALTKKVCNREGIGDILADGVKIASERIGKNSEPYAIHIGGQEPAFHDFRYEAPSRGLFYISDPTPARHERCSGSQLLQLNKSLGPYPEFQPSKVDIDDYEGVGKLYAKGSRYYTAFSACGFCAYVLGAASSLPIVELINAVTGWKDYTAQDILDAGERIQTLRQMFSIREGLTPDKVKFPSRLLEKPLFEGAMRGTDKEMDWNRLREEYFKGYNWDSKGRPSKKRMKYLGIEQFYDAE